jgi:hypothetical protein
MQPLRLPQRYPTLPCRHRRPEQLGLARAVPTVARLTLPAASMGERGPQAGAGGFRLMAGWHGGVVSTRRVARRRRGAAVGGGMAQLGIAVVPARLRSGPVWAPSGVGGP